MIPLLANSQARSGGLVGNRTELRRPITPREAEVLQWGSAGMTSLEIAESTGLSERTVNQHFANAQGKLGTRNRVHTIVEAIRRQLITL